MSKKYTKKEVVLGSGRLYHMEFTGEIPTNELIELEENIIGAIKGGASVVYTPTFSSESDDLGEITVSQLQAEAATLKSGLMTLIGETFKVLTSTARVSEKEGVTTVLIGGVDNYDGKTHLFHFVNSNKQRPVRVTVVGINEKGFELAFKQEGATVVDLEVNAQALDETGAKIKIQLGEKSVSA